MQYRVGGYSLEICRTVTDTVVEEVTKFYNNSHNGIKTSIWKKGKDPKLKNSKTHLKDRKGNKSKLFSVEPV